MSKKTLPTVTLRPASIFRYNQREYGWKLMENVKPDDGELTLQFDEFAKEGEPYVKGIVMMSRAKDMGRLAGQLHAERLLNNRDIPKELRAFYPIFAGTVWCDSQDNLCVPYLEWSSAWWILRFGQLDIDFSSRGRLARLSK